MEVPRKGSISIGEIVEESVRRPPELVKDLLLHRTVTVIGADPHSGKTAMMLDMAICLESGKKLFGVLDVMPARTLFIGTDPEFHLWLRAYHEAKPFDVLMLDTALDMHPFDENDNTEMSKFGKILKGIRDKLGCSIVVAHHLSHPQKDMARRIRGGSVLRGNIDFEIILTPKDPRTSNPRRVSMNVSKARGFGADDVGLRGFMISDPGAPGAAQMRLEAWFGD